MAARTADRGPPGRPAAVRLGRDGAEQRVHRGPGEFLARFAPAYPGADPAHRGRAASHVDQGQLVDMATLIPDCELVTIPAGHLVHAARPAEFTAAVCAFLRRPSR